MSKHQRQDARLRGQAAEAQALQLYQTQGAQCLAQGYRTRGGRGYGGGEIDLIVAWPQRRLLVFCEVKHRATIEQALESLTPRQQARIRATAGLWLSEHPEQAEWTCRFDLVALGPDQSVMIVENAW